MRDLAAVLAVFATWAAACLIAVALTCALTPKDGRS
jgi:hypothetical protein